MMLGKLQRAHPTLCGHFAPAYLVGSNMLRAYIFFIYGWDTDTRIYVKIVDYDIIQYLEIEIK